QGPLASGRPRGLVVGAIVVGAFPFAHAARRCVVGRAHAGPRRAWPRAEAGTQSARLAARTPRWLSFDHPCPRWGCGRLQFRCPRGGWLGGLSSNFPRTPASRASLQPIGGGDGGFLPQRQVAVAFAAEPTDRRFAGDISQACFKKRSSHRNARAW